MKVEINLIVLYCKVIRHNGVFLWNNLPVNIRQQVTLSSFKTKLKLYLFCMYCI